VVRAEEAQARQRDVARPLATIGSVTWLPLMQSGTMVRLYRKEWIQPFRPAK
jgi:hypothetical protein